MTKAICIKCGKTLGIVMNVEGTGSLQVQFNCENCYVEYLAHDIAQRLPKLKDIDEFEQLIIDSKL